MITVFPKRKLLCVLEFVLKIQFCALRAQYYTVFPLRSSCAILHCFPPARFARNITLFSVCTLRAQYYTLFSVCTLPRNITLFSPARFARNITLFSVCTLRAQYYTVFPLHAARGILHCFPPAQYYTVFRLRAILHCFPSARFARNITLFSPCLLTQYERRFSLSDCLAPR